MVGICHIFFVSNLERNVTLWLCACLRLWCLRTISNVTWALGLGLRWAISVEISIKSSLYVLSYGMWGICKCEFEIIVSVSLIISRHGVARHPRPHSWLTTADLIDYTWAAVISTSCKYWSYPATTQATGGVKQQIVRYNNRYSKMMYWLKLVRQKWCNLCMMSG